MNETEPTMPAPAPQHSNQSAALTARRGPDLLTLVAGLGALGLATATLLGSTAWLPDVDGRWVIAVLALIIGGFLVIVSLRPQRH
jgi:hypothetical protein